MTIPSSGTITSAHVAAEIGYPFTIPSTATRNLTGRASGSITWPTDFYGQTGGGICAEGSTLSDVTAGGVAVVLNASYGATAWNRRVFAAVEWACSTSAVETLLSSVVFENGTDERIHVQTGEGGTSAFTNYGVAIISALCPTGADGNISLDFNNGTVRTARVTTYRCTGLVSAVAHDTASAFDEHLFAPSSVSAQSVINVPSNGLLLVSGMVSSGAALGALTFTGATERVDNLGTLDDRYGSAMSIALGSQVNRPVGLAGTAADASRARMVAASFQLRT